MQESEINKNFDHSLLSFPGFNIILEIFHKVKDDTLIRSIVQKFKPQFWYNTKETCI